MKYIFFYLDSLGNNITFELVTECIYLKGYDNFLLGVTWISISYINMKLTEEYTGVTVTYYYVLFCIIKFSKHF